MAESTAAQHHSSDCYPDIRYRTQAAALLSLAAVAPSLSQAELRTAVYLASIEDPDHHTAVASSRQIATATRLERKNVIRALDSLGARYLITTHQGYGRRPSSYLLNFTQTAALPSGVTVTPLAGQSGVTATPLLPLFSDGVVSQRHHSLEPQTPLDKDFDYELIDRILRAKKTDFPDRDIAAVRQAIHGYTAKLRELHGDPVAHAPDDRIAAQILTAAHGNVDQLRNLIQDLWIDRTIPGDKYGWYLAVVLQRWHGIRFSQVKARGAYLKLVTAARRQTSPEPTQDNLEFAGDLIADLAKAKGMAGR